MPTNDEKGYNGWKNYETWAVALWIDNEPGTYEDRISMWQQIKDDEDKDSSVLKYAQALKEWIEELQPDLSASLWSDLLGAALSEVDWYEIAENWSQEE